MKAVIRATRPENIEFTLEITMCMADWKSLADQLRKSDKSTCYPNYKFREAIVELVEKAQKNFYFQEDKGDEVG
jgi:hypothetical protein